MALTIGGILAFVFIASIALLIATLPLFFLYNIWLHFKGETAQHRTAQAIEKIIELAEQEETNKRSSQ